ncbi:hypothetical protein CTZ27_24830 [Streptomyces griseocarneus]|nr:hypothetical protein CTZ27_24830 [Streptomyces griseocarneus]
MAAASVLVTGPTALPASAHPADTAHPLITCLGNAAVRFTPGLALLPRDSRISGDARYLCAGTDPALTSATSVIKGGGKTSCLSLDTTAVEFVTWNTGEHSKVLYKTRHLAQPLIGEVLSLVEGKVIEGKFKDHPVGSPGAQITLDPLSCATEKGVQEIDGPTTLVFT